MEFLSLAILVIGLAYVLQKRRELAKQKLVYSVVHIQAKTEDAETMDFAVNLLVCESKEEREAKLQEIFEITENRRKYNNERMEAAFKAHQAQLEDLKKQA